mmetsp:Transcript_21701/g.52858  ORF Transcript_21701/g.52858 Transcript_21701/m.52858 type:complete len:118 (-) Transcript_21701:9-362(-)
MTDSSFHRVPDVECGFWSLSDEQIQAKTPSWPVCKMLLPACMILVGVTVVFALNLDAEPCAAALDRGIVGLGILRVQWLAGGTGGRHSEDRARHSPSAAKPAASPGTGETPAPRVEG